jgi:hypothetical protein
LPSGSALIDNLLAATAEKLADDAQIRRPAWTERLPPLYTPWTAPTTPRKLNRPGFCIRSFITLEGSGDASEEGVHGRVQGAGRQVRTRGDRAGRVTEARV